MKKTTLSLFSFFAFLILFNACSTDVDLYADYKDITVVYGLLDSDADTNFIKINKAFLGPGNAYDIALNADSCNYPEKLNARIIEYRASASGSNYQKITEFPLDTITVHDKEVGLFYAPDQLVYYTTHKINKNTEQYHYRYELQIERGDSIVSATTNIVGGGLFSVPQGSFNFSSSTNEGKVKFFPCEYASLYEVFFKFHFTEVSPSGSVERCMTWPLGSHAAADLFMENGLYIVSYTASMFFDNLATMLGDDTLATDVVRQFTDYPLEVCVAAGGDELYNFITDNGPSSSIVQTLPEYTNVHGGYGVLSSRTMYSKWMRLAGLTVPDLEGHDNWHFKQI